MVEAALAAINPRVTKQNGHIVYLWVAELAPKPSLKPRRLRGAISTAQPGKS
ncbi:MAG TPA: hypothetical protein VGS11_10655 [Candidatus Bathyarchaeia archaeon]|nr:hypothetical protein [Candidatus Bathyarchaeia archaeon]